MKKPYSLLTVVIVFLTVFKVSAQSNDNGGSGFDQLIKSSPGDVTKLVQSYLQPAFKGFGTGMNSGWNNTAKTKKLLHFDLRISVAAALVPDLDKSFDVTKIGLSSHVTPADPSNVIAPTLAGSRNDGPIMNINDDNGKKVNQFTMPKGQLPAQYVPAPNVQLTIGIFKNTDITIRAIPSINLGSDGGSVNAFGFGIKHDLIQDFAGGKKIIPFDLAVAVNYNKLNYSKSLSVQPDAGSQPAPGTQAADFSTQKVDASVSGLNIQAIISKKMAFFTPFFSLGYQTATSIFNISGNYPVQSTAPGQSGYYLSVHNPVQINQNSISGVRADIGFQLELSIFRLYASYSVGEYQSANAGIGFGF